MNDQRTYQGSCHCGRVSFELRGNVSGAMRCICPICSKVGALWHGTNDESLRIVQGRDEFVAYRFNTRAATHYFRKHCGIHPFSHPRLDPAKWAVNLRCVQGVDVESLKVAVFDGADWEQAAQDFVSRPRGSGASPLKKDARHPDDAAAPSSNMAITPSGKIGGSRDCLARDEPLFTLHRSTECPALAITNR